MLFWPFLSLQPNLLKLGQLWWHVRERAVKELPSAFSRGFLPIISFETMTHFRRNMALSAKFWHLVTSGDLNINVSEKWLKFLRKYLLRVIERSFPRPSITLSFWIGRCRHFDNPPPPTRVNVAETPPGRVLTPLRNMGVSLDAITKAGQWHCQPFQAPAPLSLRALSANLNCEYLFQAISFYF